MKKRKRAFSECMKPKAEGVEPIQTKEIQLNIIELIPEKREKYDFIFDFDEASSAWRSNKKSTGNGHYKYVCEGFCKTGKKCVREPEANCAFCNWHNKE